MSKFSSKNSRKRNFSVKLRKLSIQNYKGIDSLELDFPPPDMPDDPDILIMGSENGLGKTSVLECCSLLLFALSQSCRENPENLINFRYI
ncbi:MAG: AAA family ATPase, partial [Planctomycetaceae bacterium]|nr:AAA family ATPase [Planctomycetaceae bacterium]